MPKLRATALVSALPVILKRNADEENYRIYMSDMAVNVFRAMSGTKEKIPRYHDFVYPPKEETRTAEEIKEYMKNRLREVSEQ